MSCNSKSMYNLCKLSIYYDVHGLILFTGNSNKERRRVGPVDNTWTSVLWVQVRFPEVSALSPPLTVVRTLLDSYFSCPNQTKD